jgi:hypothetical protein
VKPPPTKSPTTGSQKNPNTNGSQFPKAGTRINKRRMTLFGGGGGSRHLNCFMSFILIY